MNRNRTQARKLVAAERKLDVLQLRREGHTFQEIGDKLSITRQRAGQIVVEEMKRLSDEIDAEAVVARAIESERLDNLTRVLYPKAIKGDLQATDRMLKVMDRRAKLFGLDAPTRSEVAMTTTTDSDLLGLADRFG